jgi:CheY-like chemotaxis protein
MDVQMPVMDGWEATRQIRRREAATPHLPPSYIIGQTAYATTEDEQKCREAGMDFHLTKPITLASLAAALRAATERSKPITN